MTRNLFRYGITAMLLLWTAVCLAIPARPEPPRLVNDFAGLFSTSQAMRLEQVLTAFDDSTSNQIAVVTVNDLEGYSPAEYGTRIGLQWGVGSEKFDNGIIVLVKPKTRDSNGQVNISVGYGLEGAIPDAYAKRIIDNEMIPHFAEGDYFGGVAAGCAVLMKLASGEISEPDSGDDDLGGVIALLLLIIFIITVASVFGRKGGGHNNRGNGGGPDLLDALIIGSLLNSSGHHRSGGGWSSSGGGFGGFGGFGGGSFGGGGASGSW